MSRREAGCARGAKVLLLAALGSRSEPGPCKLTGNEPQKGTRFTTIELAEERIRAQAARGRGGHAHRVVKGLIPCARQPDHGRGRELVARHSVGAAGRLGDLQDAGDGEELQQVAQDLRDLEPCAEWS